MQVCKKLFKVDCIMMKVSPNLIALRSVIQDDCNHLKLLTLEVGYRVFLRIMSWLRRVWLCGLVDGTCQIEAWKRENKNL